MTRTQLGINESLTSFPDSAGHFGAFGGRFVSETLMGALDELTEAYDSLKADPAFLAELASDFEHYVGRSSPLYFAERLTERAG